MKIGKEKYKRSIVRGDRNNLDRGSFLGGDNGRTAAVDVVVPPPEKVVLDLRREAEAAKLFESGGGSRVGGAGHHSVGGARWDSLRRRH